MKKVLTAFIIALLAMTSCVHEFPDSVEAEVVLSLKYDTNLPIYKIVDWETRASGNPDDYDVRYVIKAYPETRKGEYSSKEAKTWVFTEEDVTELDYEVSLFITEGTYRFMAWTDFVPAGTTENYFHNPDSFGEIIENTSLCGNNDMRDCYRGRTEIYVVRFGSEIPPVSGVIQMSRSIAKFSLESIDISDFRAMAALSRTESTGVKVYPADINLEDFKVVFYYTGFKPSAFNMFSDRPNDSKTGICFDSNIQLKDDGNAFIGFDYCFANSDETIVNLAIGVYDVDGTEVSLVGGIDVPMQMGKHTILRGRFMSQDSYGGVAINPEFDGEFNIVI